MGPGTPSPARPGPEDFGPNGKSVNSLPPRAQPHFPSLVEHSRGPPLPSPNKIAHSPTPHDPPPSHPSLPRAPHKPYSPPPSRRRLLFSPRVREGPRHGLGDGDVRLPGGDQPAALPHHQHLLLQQGDLPQGAHLQLLRCKLLPPTLPVLFCLRF